MQRELSDFTPFGYLRNPPHVARAWGDTEGGNLRTAADWLGVEWVYPVGRDGSSRATLAIETEIDGRACHTRAEFAAIGATSRYHTCLIFGCEWRVNGVRVGARFFLVTDNALACLVSVTNTAAAPRSIKLNLGLKIDGEPPLAHALIGQTQMDKELTVDEHRSALATLGRGADDSRAQSHASEAIARAEAVYAQLLAEDTRFERVCPRLSGDWPSHWREGLHHDFQTTRLLVQPAGGIFHDVWPAWMSAWPRVVLAEGTLDMLRLAYADPSLAQRAVLSMFRDAPQPNVPCVFRGGEYNMVAADGSRCGTSPAWCLPFLNLELLYLRTLDREWLGRLYPLAAAYVEWWLANRTDAEGWVVYKCTWESGEDGNPRLDPGGSGDADISGRVRPVELQATLAHAAGVLGFFAEQLGVDAERWQHLERQYRERTRQLFDAGEGRYRDWQIAEQRAQEPCPDRPYWGIDPCRWSAQSLTPLLLGLPLDDEEVRRHAVPPWTLWPSWTWSVVESAAAGSLFDVVGNVAFDIIDRVYRVTARRDVSSFVRPMPGSSPEFWPEDWRTYSGSDAYGWGATTANLLIRHVFGFKESRETDDWVAELTPAFPTDMLLPGAGYCIRQMHYRGREFDLSYTVLDDGLLARIAFDGQQHEFRIRNRERYTLRLD